MNESYLVQAVKKISDPRKLIVVAARRAKQLAHGAAPMVKTQDDNLINISLMEINEDLLMVEGEEPKDAKEHKEEKKRKKK